MNIVKLTNTNFQEIITQGLKVLKSGGTVVTPSETIYGLSVDPTNESAMKKVRLIKGRSADNPLALIAGNIEMVRNNFLLNEDEQKMVSLFWPGPIGSQLLIKDEVRIKKITKLALLSFYNEEKPKIAIRVTSNKVLAALSTGIGWPIVSTSANRSGQSTCLDVESIIEQFKDNEIKPDLIIDAGTLEQKPASTIIDLTEKPYQIIREGADFVKVKEFIDSL